MTNNIIDIIKEEISGFDFLGNEAEEKNQEINSQIKNTDLQKQFIIDSLSNENKIKINGVIESSIDEKNIMNIGSSSKYIFEYVLDIEYAFDSNKDPINFELKFSSDNISNENIDWNNIDVVIINNDGNEVEFDAFAKAPEKIRALFIRKYVEEFLEHSFS